MGQNGSGVCPWLIDQVRSQGSNGTTAQSLMLLGTSIGDAQPSAGKFIEKRKNLEI